MTRIIIRAMPERADMVDTLLADLPDALICYDQQRDAMDTFLRALALAGDEPAVHMEEDVRLASNFRDRLEAAIAERPEHVIQFFSMRKADLTTGSRWDSNYLMLQCTYLPAEYSALIRAYAPVWPARKEHPTGCDTLIRDWLKARRERYWIHVPSLVDHLPVKSLIDPRRSTKRQSLTFEQPE